MKPRKYPIFMVGIIISALFACSAAAAPKIDLMASVSAIQGVVEVQAAGQKEWTAAEDGMLLRKGDTIRTGAGGSCALKWAQGNVVTLTPFTNLKLDRLEISPASGGENTALGMWTGKMHARAKKLATADSRFEIKTPTAIAGVRGTKFSVGVSDDATTVMCSEGEMYVQGIAGGEVTIKSGQKTDVKKDAQPEEPANMSETETEELESVEEVSAPTLEIMQPVGNLETDATPVSVQGLADPGSTVTVNGKTVQADDSGKFTASVDLEPGVNQIKIEAANKKGNITTKTRVIKYRQAEEEKSAEDDAEEEEEGRPVELAVTSPRDGFVTRNSSVTVTGMTGHGDSVSINDVPLPVPPGMTSFSGSVPLVEGENLITVTASRGERSKSMTVTVVKDTLPPLLDITQPNSQFDVRGGACVREGDAIGCSVIGRTETDALLTINGGRCDVEPDGSFNRLITLAPEQTTIAIAAEDSAGNRSTRIISRTLDRAEIENLSVSVAPASIVANTVNTATITVIGSNFFNEPVNGATVNLSATSGGTLSSSTVTLENGTGIVTFTAGAGGIRNTVTITATSGGKTATTILLLLPDAPPQH